MFFSPVPGHTLPLPHHAYPGSFWWNLVQSGTWPMIEVTFPWTWLWPTVTSMCILADGGTSLVDLADLTMGSKGSHRNTGLMVSVSGIDSP